MKNIENFENELNCENNLKLTIKFVNDLKLIKNISIKKRLIDIPPTITKHRCFFGVFNYTSESDYISYDLYFDGKTITILKSISYDDEWGGDFYQQPIVDIKLKDLLKLKLK